MRVMKPRSLWAWIRFTIEILALIALFFLILMWSSPPELTATTMKVISGEVSSYQKTDSVASGVADFVDVLLVGWASKLAPVYLLRLEGSTKPSAGSNR